MQNKYVNSWILTLWQLHDIATTCACTDLAVTYPITALLFLILHHFCQNLFLYIFHVSHLQPNIEQIFFYLVSGCSAFNPEKLSTSNLFY